MKTSHSDNDAVVASHKPTFSSTGHAGRYHADMQTAIPAPYLSARQKMQAAKRLDWRFFLPNPDLTAVGYWGPEECRLARALATYGHDVHHLATSMAKTPDKRFKLIVLKNPTPSILQQAAQQLTSSGTLYLEAYGPLWPQRWFQRNLGKQLRQSPLLLQPQDYVATLQEIGFQQIQTLWIWPSFDNTSKIIPLDVEVLSYLSTTRSQGGRLTQRILKNFYQHGFITRNWFGWIIPCFSIIGRID